MHMGIGCVHTKRLYGTIQQQLHSGLPMLPCTAICVTCSWPHLVHGHHVARLVHAHEAEGPHLAHLTGRCPAHLPHAVARLVAGAAGGAGRTAVTSCKHILVGWALVAPGWRHAERPSASCEPHSSGHTWLRKHRAPTCPQPHPRTHTNTIADEALTVQGVKSSPICQ